MIISVIIPALNEEGYIENILAHTLALPGHFELIVADGGSRDKTLQIVNRFPAVKCISTEKGRANQMNAGAAIATGEIFLFLHADTYLPFNAYDLILQHLQRKDYVGGSFRLNLDRDHSFLNFYSWCSKFSFQLFTYGDHGIFIKKQVFRKIKGYKKMPFLEDIEIQGRLKKEGKFRKVCSSVTTSARRFERVGTMKQLGVDTLILILYYSGVSPAKLKKLYRDHS